MRYRLRDQLSFCLVDGHAIFLDVEADRYFRLSGAVELAFVAWASAEGELPEPALSSLVELDLIVPAAPGEEVVAAPYQTPPTLSALELHARRVRSAAWLLPEILAEAFACRRALRTHRLHEVLRATARYRDTRLEGKYPDAAPDTDRLVELAQQFRRARLLVPVAPCCLPDSLSMVRFLARRHVHARIVFGVTREPFSAHCWVQAGHIVLDDTVGNAWAHTAIKVL